MKMYNSNIVLIIKGNGNGDDEGDKTVVKDTL